MKLLRRLGTGVAVVLLLGLGPQWCGRGAAACSGYDGVLVESIERCPEARARLGDGIAPANVGMACGMTETGDARDRASWSMAFAGSRDRGTLHFDAERHGGAWKMTRGILAVGDDSIDLLACAAAAKRPTYAEAPSSLADTTVARCERGEPAACVSAGAMYESGHLVLRDVERARALYHRGCVAEHAPACRLEASLSPRRSE